MMAYSGKLNYNCPRWAKINLGIAKIWAIDLTVLKNRLKSDFLQIDCICYHEYFNPTYWAPAICRPRPVGTIHIKSGTIIHALNLVCLTCFVPKLPVILCGSIPPLLKLKWRINCQIFSPRLSVDLSPRHLPWVLLLFEGFVAFWPAELENL